MNSIPQQLRRIRRDKEITQDAITAAMGVRAPSWIGNMEKGKVSPTLSTLTKWADILGYELTLKPKNAP